MKYKLDRMASQVTCLTIMELKELLCIYKKQTSGVFSKIYWCKQYCAVIR